MPAILPLFLVALAVVVALVVDLHNLDYRHTESYLPDRLDIADPRAET